MIKFMNDYYEKQNFRWIGLFFPKRNVVGIGYSFGKQVWHIPYVEFVVNDGYIDKASFRKILSISFGWLFFCLRFQIMKG